jgi:phage baseplate assembly protein W
VSDLDMGWAGDLACTETGDLASVGLPQLGTERVLRRLLTNPGGYLWHPEYGAGLARFVGQPVDVAGIQALIRSQMLLEAAVAADPEPTVSVQSDQGGSLFVQVRYADADTAETQTLTIQLPR